MSEKEARALEEQIGAAARDNPVVRAIVMSVWRNELAPIEALSLCVRILESELRSERETTTKLLLEKPLRPMQVGGMVFTPPGWTERPLYATKPAPGNHPLACDALRDKEPEVDRRMPRPEDMNGWADQFPGSDEGSQYDRPSAT